MKELIAFTIKQNVLQDLFGEPQYPVEPTLLTKKQKQDLGWAIEGQLSPENLGCDGEISVLSARSKERLLNTVKDQLDALQ